LSNRRRTQNRHPNLAQKMLDEARTATRVMLITLAISLIALVTAVLALVFQQTSESKNQPILSATLCDGWVLKVLVPPYGSFSDCSAIPPGAQTAVIFNITNTGRFGTSIDSASFRCVTGAHCGIDITALINGNKDDLPKYLDSGANYTLQFPLGCSREHIHVSPNIPISIIGTVKIAGGVTLQTNTITLLPIPASVRLSCEQRYKIGSVTPAPSASTGT
jgi:hypothetical protein